MNYSSESKRVVSFWFVMVLSGLIGWMAGCDPTRDNTEAQPPSEPNQSSSAVSEVQSAAPKPAASGSVDAVVERILSGDFVGASQTCDFLKTSSEPKMEQLANVLNRYHELQKVRERKRRAAYEEQIGEINKLKEKIKGDINEPNDIDQTLAAAIRAREYADEKDKAAVVNDPFVVKAITKAKEASIQYEKDGKWIDSYTHCYYWLTLLDEENKEYKDHVEKLTEMASIELSLKKDDCGQTAMERYEDIQPVMFIRALQALESAYITDIDYAQMCEKAVTRCRLLGRVLLDSKEELTWKTDPNKLDTWTSGLAALGDDLTNQKEKKGLSDIAQLFDNVLSLNQTTLSLPQEVIVAHFAEAALMALDPFTNLIWPWNVRDFEKSMTQQFSGIGVEISKATGVLKIGSLLPDTPAYRAGLDADDEIVAVNGEPTEKMTIYCAVDKITGEKGTKVRLTMRRPSTNKTWDVTIVRDKIVVQPLRGWQRKTDGQWDWIVDPVNRIAYIRLSTFTETSGPDLDKVLTDLEKDGLNGLILDLRYNPGGYLTSAAEVVDLFIKEGVIVKSNPRHGFASYEIAHAKGTHPDYPLAILINEGSASASEIVSGALQDPKYVRATLVGERSYGKGSVQVVSPYPGGGAQMKYTIAYYHLPSDQQVKNRYQMEKLGRKDWGIAPDVEVKTNTAELRSILEMQRDNEVLVQADHDETRSPTKRNNLAQTLEADPQLATALLVIQTKLIQTGKELTFPSDPNTIVLKK